MKESWTIQETATTGARAPVLRRRRRFWIGIVLMVIGLAGLAVPFLSFGLSRDEGVLLRSMGHQEELSPAASASAIEEPAEDGRIKDRMSISNLGIDMPLLAWKDSEAALYTGAWLWPNGSRPGSKGNTVIFGHRFRYLPPLSNTLFNLGKADNGDTITIKWKDSEYSYRVVEKRVIEPTDLSPLAVSPEEEITIITCNPLFSTRQRLVVRAVRVP